MGLSSLSAFWRWWIGELNELFSGLRPQRQKQGPALIRLSFGVTGAVAEEIKDGQAREVVRTEGVAAVSDTLTAIGEDMAKQGIAADNWELILPTSATLERSVDLPSVEAHQVRKAVSYQIDRFMPLRADQTLFDSVVVETVDGKVNKADLALVKWATVDEAVLALKARGVRFFRVCARSKRDPAILFEFFRTYGFGRVRRGNLRKVLGVALVFSAAIVPAVYIGFSIYKHHVVEAREQALRASVRAVEVLHGQMTDKTELWRFIHEKAAVPQLLAVINGLSSVLPQDAWIYDLKQDGLTIVIMGEATGAQKLIPLIEGSNLFANVTNRTVSMAQGVTGGRERFEISLELEAARPEASPGSSKR